ncbi:BBP7 family outer membrane beta-barrel protein [Lacipirellula sp.]|uniref:BBP7 family outer membrane beta-barrel protein n=1 Tax=Lacipirellula sp. TaxID=2691419 RepID=UPI003D0E5DE1
MTVRKLTRWLAACLLVAAGADRAAAQATDAWCEDCCEHDMQWFAPVDFDFDCEPIQRGCGYGFSYDRLVWAMTGERNRIGTAGTSNGSLAPWRQFLTGRFLADGTATPVVIPPPDLLGGLDSAPPNAVFDWGHRYNFSYYNGDEAWNINVLDGPTFANQQLYGSETQDTIYGSTMIVFDDPQNLMVGWIDVVGPLGGAYQPDGIADDIDGDGQFGPDGYDLDSPGREPDSILLDDQRGDFDDLVTLPVSFRFLGVRQATQTRGIELMRTHRLSNLHKMTKDQNNTVEIGAGIRYFRMRDDFDVAGSGGTMGLSFWDTRVTNNLLGPQISAQWNHQNKRWNLGVGGRFMFAYNMQDFEQNTALGRDLVPGQYNRPLYMVTTVTDHGKQENDFSPTAEIRADLNYQLTRAIALRIGYTAMFIDNVSRAASQVRYELPRMGFIDDQAGKQNVFMNGANFGFDVNF